MANLYLRSTNGTADADDGSSWALAKTTLLGIAAVDSAGDTIYVSQVHSESSASVQSIVLNGTISNPTQITCGNDGATPPTAVAATAVIATTGASDINIHGHARFYGITFIAGNSTSAAIIRLVNTAGDMQIYKSCSFQLGGSSSGNRIYACNASGSSIVVLKWESCSVKFAHASQCISVNGGFFEWTAGSAIGSGGGGVNPTTLITNGVGSAATAMIRNVDLSGLSSTLNLCAAANGMLVIFANCKLPASWSGSLVSGTRITTFRAEMYNCDSTDTNYRIWIYDFAGDLIQELVKIRSGGASDGTTPFAWKMTSTANCNYLTGRFGSGKIQYFNSAIGSPITVTIEILHDSVTALNDDEVWIEIEYLGTSGYPLGATLDDAKATILTTPAAQASSSETWTTTGLANPNKQKVSCTFTPQEVGWFRAQVWMGKASYTIYVDPFLTIT